LDFRLNDNSSKTALALCLARSLLPLSRLSIENQKSKMDLRKTPYVLPQNALALATIPSASNPAAANWAARESCSMNASGTARRWIFRTSAPAAAVASSTADPNPPGSV
jgi:hypothetical protein